mmetsp:Transcript_15778/g.45457  ORF Transcript_15778/g.45457 Transcript_15778/m.45457 type:complete len:105 (-) Transcript_15778:2581-2895(-)
MLMLGIQRKRPAASVFPGYPSPSNCHDIEEMRSPDAEKHSVPRYVGLPFSPQTQFNSPASSSRQATWNESEMLLARNVSTFALSCHYYYIVHFCFTKRSQTCCI